MKTVLASFKKDGDNGSKFDVHFNPASLKLAVTNTIADQSGNAGQTPSKSATKLDLELVFDTTGEAKDVREASGKLKALGFLGDSQRELPKVVFEWGTFSFTGVIESLNETFEFFSADGLPLRETIQVSLKGLKLDTMKAAARGGSQAPAQGLAPPASGGLGTTGLAQGLGNPQAGRAIAAQNGLESMRFPGTPSLAVGGDAALKGPAGLSAPPSMAGDIAPGSMFGASASAGVPAGLGAFAGLGTAKPPPTGLNVNIAALSTVATIGSGDTFDLTGKLTTATGLPPDLI